MLGDPLASNILSNCSTTVQYRLRIMAVSLTGLNSASRVRSFTGIVYAK